MLYDKGSGPAVIVIPGVQGRWEWMKPALDALGRRCRTVSYSLCGDFGSGMTFDPGRGFDNYVEQLDEVFKRANLERAALCAISHGGFIAVRYAATRPENVTSLVLVSTPAPGWAPNDRQRRYIARPWVSVPAFVATSPQRLWPEIHAAFDTWPGRLGFAARHVARVIAAPMNPPLMASRVTEEQRLDFAPDCARITAPTLVVSGEPHLDRVVPADVTRRYESLISGARYEMLERTGHIGLVTRPDRFSSLVSEFVHAHDH